MKTDSPSPGCADCQHAVSPARRSFLADAVMLVPLLLSGGVGLAHAVRFLMPGVQRPEEVDLPVAKEDELGVGDTKQIPNLLGHSVLLIRTMTGYRAFSAVCSHLGCFVHYEHEKKRFLCPCHMGVFDLNGQVVSGPPPKPLTEYTVTVRNQRVYVRTPVEGVA